jgi:multidrug efflux pump subunit AcrB
MNFATWSIRNPIPSILLFVLLSLAGLIGLQKLGVQDFPDLDFPTVTATLRLPGAAPAQMETEIARKVEDNLATLSGLKHIRTAITEGQVRITVEFQLGRDLSDALIDVKDAIDKVRNDLPADMEQPQVSKVTISPGGAMATYAVTSSQLDEEALSWFIDDTIARTLLAVPGVGQFTRVGGGQREVQVQVDPARLNALGITAADVSRALKRVQQEASGGRGQLGGAEQGLRTIATVQQASDLGALPVAIGLDRWVRLDEVATVRDTLADRTQAALLDGKPAVGFQLQRSKGFDELTVAAAAEHALATLKAEHPDLSYRRVSTTVNHTSEQYNSSMHMLYEGAILAVLVVWVFLRDWRATLVGAAALPLSILPAFAVMYWVGFNLNTITLLSLSVVVGILVDDAIVEIENIARHVRMGKGVVQATEEAVTEIALPVMATTLALVVVFVPTALMSGVPGLIFKQFGWTAVVAILASLLVARLATPMMAAYWLKPSTHEEKDGRLMRAYLRLAQLCLAHRKTTLALGTLVFIASLALVPLLPTGFVPAGDRGYTSVNIELPPGASLESTLSVAEAARQAIADVAGIASIFTTVGGDQAVSVGQTSLGEVRKATLTLTFGERGHRPGQIAIENTVRERLQAVAGARVSVGAGAVGQKLVLVLTGRDAYALKAAAQSVEAGLRGLPFLGGVTSTASLERPEITLRPDPARAAERGVSAQAIGETLRIATSGDFNAALAKLKLDNRQVDIRVRMPEAMRADLQAISSLRVASRSGLIPLDSVASITLGSGPSQIDRYDRSRNVTLSADLGGYPLGEALEQAKKLPAVLALPRGIQLIDSGDAEFMAELFGGFGWALGIGVFCIYCVLVLLFKDFFQPITIMSAVPLSVGGAFVALLAFHSELGLPVMIGLVMLLGIVTKNSILLVEYAIMAMREHGMSEREALIDACHKRARPIVMTTVAMVAGMLPLALGLSGDGSFRQPMAIAVIGGLITSTALSLLMVPVVFTYVAGVKRGLRKLFGRKPAQGPAGLTV